MITTDHLMIDRRILLEARTLIGEGYDVRLLAGFECSKPDELEIDGLRIHRYTFDWCDPRIDPWMTKLTVGPQVLRNFAIRAGRHIAAKWTGLTSFEIFVLNKILAFDFDILHCHDFPLLNVANEAVRRRPAKLVYDAHELYHAQTQLPAEVQAKYKKTERRLIRRPDLVITVNPFIAEIMSRDYGIAPPQVILNATDVPVPSGADRLRAMTGIPEQDEIILYQGWISPERGIDRLVRCASGFPPNIHLVIIGYGAFEDELRRISKEQGTDDGRVMFMGQVANAALGAMTPFASLGVIPYHGVDLNNYYCSPNKLFEFIAAGVPFVSNDLPFLHSVAEQFNCGILVDFADPLSAAETLVKILEDQDTLAQLRANTENASRTLNWSVEGKKLADLYSAM